MKEMKEKNSQKPEIWYRELEKIVRLYLPEKDIPVIRAAFELAKKEHAPQVRESGEPYIIHPINVSIILAGLRADRQTIVAGLLHDVVEDTPVSEEQIRRDFGEEVAFLVDGVTKIAKLHENLPKAQIKQESFLKLMLAAAKDIRVVVIKLADRLHNMRTLQFQPKQKQESISNETLEIYAPIAQRLGISVFSRELEDLAFSYLKPEAYWNIRTQIEHNDYRGKLAPEMEEIDRLLTEENILHEVRYYQKHLFSVYRKMLSRRKTMDELNDIGVINVITENVRDCYIALWKLHSSYKMIPGRIKDYISLPNENMYQALHTAVISKNGKQFKLRIMTREMERFSRLGVLSRPESLVCTPEAGSPEAGDRLLWLKCILQWQKDTKSISELMDLVREDFDLFLEKIYCFTPNAEEKRLPRDSTVLDFAYSIHSEIGNKAIGAVVNGRRKSLFAVLEDGDMVEVLIKEDSEGPQEEWLDFVKTGNARSNIRRWLKQHSPQKPEEEKTEEEEEREKLNIQIGRCCLPVPGDAVTGVMSNQHYLTLHRKGCETARKLLQRSGFKEKEVRWTDVNTERFNTTLILTERENSGSRFLAEVWTYLNIHGYQVSRMEFSEKKQKLMFTIEVGDKKELERVMEALGKISGILSVVRAE